MIVFLALLGSLIAASGTVPYVLETIRGKAKPRLVSWLTWTLLMGVATAGALADHQIGSALFSLLGAVATGSIVVAGWRYGDRGFQPLDIACMCGVVAGLVLWQVFDDPAIAVWASIIIDVIGLIPTLKHAWQAPQEETLSTYILVGVGGTVTVIASAIGSGWTVTAVGYPLYAALSLSAVAAVVQIRGRKQLRTAKVPMVELSEEQ